MKEIDITKFIPNIMDYGLKKKKLFYAKKKKKKKK